MKNQSLNRRLRATAILSVVAVFGCVGGMIAWAATAPLSGAAVARGAFAPETSRKTIQHLEGGIVREILVKDGDEVKRGQTLFVVESIVAKATLEASTGTLNRLMASRARLQALLKPDGKFDVAAEIARAPDDAGYVAFVAGQSELFETLRRGEREKRDILERQIAQLEADIKSGQAQLDSLKRQIPHIKTQLEDQKYLLEKGLTRKPVVLELERTREKMEGDMQALLASLEKGREQIAEKRTTLINLVTQFEKQIADELVKTNSDVAEGQSKLVGAKDIVARNVVTAPEDGTVYNLRVKTIGGVLGAGQPLIDLVPHNDELIVAGRIMPNDIAHVHAGQTTKIALIAYPQRGVPLIPAKLKTVTADLVTDPNARVPGTESYYEARIVIDRKVLKEMAPWVEPVPGMPVEAYIETHPRVALDYFLEPFTRSVNLAFREL